MRLKIPTLAAMFVLALPLAGCSTPSHETDSGAASPSSPPETSSTGAGSSQPQQDPTSASAAEGTPITIRVDGETLTGTLSDNAAARSLARQLPLTLSFKDYGGQEKIADLPEPLPLDGVPAGDSADPLAIGYYAPDQAIVLYYERVGYSRGIVRIGSFDDLAAIRDRTDDFTATLAPAT